MTRARAGVRRPGHLLAELLRGVVTADIGPSQLESRSAGRSRRGASNTRPDIPLRAPPFTVALKSPRG